ncbi:MFS transporter [Bosea lathyri]|uniref:MFS transporter, PPP family, 3-phenylpropionic acid transporter n=1 Tax=Bosea lathyri TaxID=1036778 RepID=A0A1H5Z1S5_9HYPH|nr:MFS transporter [Bosea lathyri]SEG30194.1 MFS transporter, PPP family, 3-phenylpropionic acid transporter [Bosea lathyri]
MSRATGRLSFLYAALFFELGVNLPFFPLWLRASALEDSVIGIVLAAPLLTRIVANPIVAAFVDRTGRMAAALVACSVLVVLGTALLAFAHGFVQILLLVVVIASAQGPLIALTDAVTLRVLSRLHAAELRYGRIRLWGSAGFALANIVAGWMLDWLPTSSIIGMLLISALVTALAAIAIAGVRAPELAPSATIAVGRLDRPWLLGFTIAGAALVQASHAAVYAFSALHWQSSGMSGAAIGGLWAVGVVSEIVLFSVVGHALIGSAALLLGSAAIATIRWSGMALDPHLGFLVGLQLLQGVTFGMTHLGSVFLLARLAPASMLAQVQAWMAAGWAGAMAVLMSLSGYLYGSWGEQIYWLMAIAAGAGFLLLLPVAISQAREGASEPRPA